MELRELFNFCAILYESSINPLTINHTFDFLKLLHGFFFKFCVDISWVNLCQDFYNGDATLILFWIIDNFVYYWPFLKRSSSLKLISRNHESLIMVNFENKVFETNYWIGMWHHSCTFIEGKYCPPQLRWNSVWIHVCVGSWPRNSSFVKSESTRPQAEAIQIHWWRVLRSLCHLNSNQLWKPYC